MSFYTRTKGLDKHVGTRIRKTAAYMKRWDDKYHEGKDPCGDTARMRTLATMWTNHADTVAIYEFMWDGDTAWRDAVPRPVWDIIDENYKNVKAS